MPDESIGSLLYKSVSNRSWSSTQLAAIPRPRMIGIARAIVFFSIPQPFGARRYTSPCLDDGYVHVGRYSSYNHYHWYNP